MIAGRAEGTQPISGLEQIFMDHKDLVFRTAYKITGNANDAEDILQSVFLKLLRQRQLPEIRSMKAYLHRAAINAALDLLRLRKDTQNLALEEEDSASQPMSKDMQASGEVRDWLRHQPNLSLDLDGHAQGLDMHLGGESQTTGLGDRERQRLVELDKD